MLIGNKSDLNQGRAVSEKEGRALASSLGIPFLETSAKERTNVETMFVSMAKYIFEQKNAKVLENSKELKGIQLMNGTEITDGQNELRCSYC